MLSQKFWKSVFKDGFIRTYQRGHRTHRNAQYMAGHTGLVKCVGQDRFGNKYYEDLSVDHHYNRRWVEHADFLIAAEMNEDKLEPGWLGWLSYSYDDVPSDGHNFVSHGYIKETEERHFSRSNVKLPQGFQHIENPIDREAFIREQRDRKAAPWEVLEQEVGARNPRKCRSRGPTWSGS